MGSKVCLELRNLRKKLLSKVLGHQLDVRTSWITTPERFKDLVEFLNWFDTTTSTADCLARAEKDWKYRFQMFPYYLSMNKCAALEIGFGGGRLLSQAARDFQHVYGVDIHESFAMTEKFLHSLEVRNYTLLRRENLSSLADESMDFIFSFIVFQHFDGFEEVVFYLSEIQRILKEEGYAHIYYGKNRDKGVRVTKPDEFQPRACSLFIEPALMRDLVSKRFEVVDHRESLARDPETGAGQSGQAYIIFRRARAPLIASEALCEAGHGKPGREELLSGL